MEMLDFNLIVAGSSLTSRVLGSKGDSEGRSSRGLSSGTGFGGAGVEAEQGKGGPSLGNVPPDGDFFIDGSLFGAIFKKLITGYLNLSLSVNVVLYRDERE